MNRNELLIDNEFRRLVLPKSNEKLEQLKINLLNKGCLSSIPVWNGFILDGYDRYKICVDNKIDFEIQDIKAADRNEAMEWICIRQLKRRDLNPKMKTYLIGKLCIIKRIILNSKGIPTNSIIESAAKEYKKSPTTICKYSTFARAIDRLYDSNEKLATDFLSENTKKSYDDILKIVSDTVPVSNTFKSPCKEQTAQIKTMPQYDPDADLAGLKLTIPSWIGSIERVRLSADFKKASSMTKKQLEAALYELKKETEVLINTMEEIQNG